MDNLKKAYNKAPKQVKKLLNDFGDSTDYRDLENLNNKLKKYGYSIEYYLDGIITDIIKLS